MNTAIGGSRRALYAVFLFSQDATTGIQNKLRQYAAAFAEEDIDVVVFNPVRHEREGNIDWVRYGGESRPYLFKLRLMLFKYAHLSRYLQGRDYAAVLLRYAFFDLSLPRFFRQMRGRKVYLEFHSRGLEEIWRYKMPWPMRAALYWNERLAGPRYIRRADGLVAVTGEIARYEAERCAVPERVRLHTFSNGYDAAPARSYVGPERGEPFVLAFVAAQFQPWHGLDRLLASLRQRSGARQVVLHIVGKVHDRGELELIDAVNGTPGTRVVMHGLLPAAQVHAVLADAHVALDSLAMYRLKMEESSTLKAKEYLAMGVPYAGSAVDVDAGDASFFHKVANDDTPIDIDAIISWRDKLVLPGPQEMDGLRARLGWRSKVAALRRFMLGGAA